MIYFIYIFYDNKLALHTAHAKLAVRWRVSVPRLWVRNWHQGPLIEYSQILGNPHPHQATSCDIQILVGPLWSLHLGDIGNQYTSCTGFLRVLPPRALLLLHRKLLSARFEDDRFTLRSWMSPPGRSATQKVGSGSEFCTRRLKFGLYFANSAVLQT